MEVKERGTFEHSVDVLVKAYMRGELEHGNCCACAVGNLVAEAAGTRPLRFAPPDVTGRHFSAGIYENGMIVQWQLAFCSNFGFQSQTPEAIFGKCKEQIDSTGYSWEDLARIEKAFETTKRKYIGDELDEEAWMFDGLMAVVDVLADIHGVDLTAREKATSQFREVQLQKVIVL